MIDTKRQIQILPHGRTIRAIAGQSLLEALIHKSIFLRSDCGGKGKCGKCLVETVSDDGTAKAVESCQYQVNEDVCIKIPESSMLSSHIMDKAPVSFPDAFSRLQNRKKKDAYGIAVDLGTTTIAVYLCNTAKGKIISSLSVKNPQAIYGDDVMSRIGIIGQDPENLKALQNLVVKSIDWGIKELLSAFKKTKSSISGMVVVGNPAMIHILAGIDPQPIGVSPYQPVFHEPKSFQAKNLGFDLDDIPIQTLPQISGFIGGDILAAALAVDLENQSEGTLLVDLGTNGELMLKAGDRLYATSCATGPAFEGATLSCGMQAIPSAINAINIDKNQDITGYSLVDSGKSSKIYPGGICGAGVVNAVAQFLARNIIDPGGAFTSGKKKYTLVSENPDVNQNAIYISQKDIRSVQLGKAALMTGIEFLLKSADLEQPEKIIIAGAFGSHLNVMDMVTLGMIPGMELDRVEIAGNSAGSGAIMALCDTCFLDKTITMADRITTIDLACNINFQERFVQNLSFPIMNIKNM